MNRRRFFAALAAGAIVTAEGLWIPGAKLISIPKAPRFEFNRIPLTMISTPDGADPERFFAIMHPLAARQLLDSEQWSESHLAKMAARKKAFFGPGKGFFCTKLVPNSAAGAA